MRRLSLRGNGAFSLIELVVTIAVMSVIMLGVGSAMLIASHAVPTADSPTGAMLVAGRVAAQIATELQYAVSVIDSNATAIEFTVADRDGNDMPETIRYEWSGTPGDPLIRKYNSTAALALLADVSQFDLSYNLKTVATETPTVNESAETSLSSYHAIADLGQYMVKTNQWYAQYFRPSLEAGAVSWKITRVQFEARSSGGTTGEVRVQLQWAEAGGLPSGMVLEEKTLLESALTLSCVVQEFDFSNVTDLSPDQGLCLVFKWISDGTACELHGQTSGATPADGHVLKSADSGLSWSVENGNSLLYAVYGTVKTPGTPLVETTQYLGGVTLTLQAGSDGQSVVQTGSRVLNEPEMTP